MVLRIGYKQPGWKHSKLIPRLRTRDLRSDPSRLCVQWQSHQYTGGRGQTYYLASIRSGKREFSKSTWNRYSHQQMIISQVQNGPSTHCPSAPRRTIQMQLLNHEPQGAIFRFGASGIPLLRPKIWRFGWIWPGVLYQLMQASTSPPAPPSQTSHS